MKTALSLLACLVTTSFSHALDVVATRAGKVSGSPATDGAVVSFKGIPFAAPPVGELRWKAPQPVAPWDGVRACTALGPSPMQRKPAPFSMWSREFLIPEEPISEDCLYLNVWTPAKSAGEKLPVLVWIYGGGFNSGGSGCPIYDGEAMARKGIVFVSPNYRVGIFGFYAHPELTREASYRASGNYGLLDQLAALQWVRDNIAAFGGDPDRVTVAGQSAGSMSVNCLVASPLAKGLIHRAIGESGAAFSRTATTLAQAEQAGIEAAQSVGASTLAEMRAKPAEELMKARSRNGPIIDGHVLPQSVAEIFAAGKQNPVDLLTGWNQDEGLSSGPVRNAADWRKEIRERYGDNADQLLKFYPATDDATAAQSQADLSRDQIFGGANYTWANATAAAGRGKVFVYRFTRKVPGTGEYAKYGAFHTGEVPYAYDNLKFVDRPWEPVDHRLASAMSAYWVNFVRTGDPNGPALPNWPHYEAGGKQTLLLGNTVEARPMPDAAALDFLNSVRPAARN